MQTLFGVKYMLLVTALLGVQKTMIFIGGKFLLLCECRVISVHQFVKVHHLLDPVIVLFFIIYIYMYKSDREMLYILYIYIYL